MTRYEIALGKTPPPPPIIVKEQSPYFMGIDFGFRGTSEILVAHLEKLSDHNKFIIDHSISMQEDLPEKTMEQVSRIYSHFRQDRIVLSRMDQEPDRFGIHYMRLPVDSVRVTHRWKTDLFEKCSGYRIHFDNPFSPPDRLKTFQGSLELALSLAVSYLDLQKPQQQSFRHLPFSSGLSI